MKKASTVLSKIARIALSLTLIAAILIASVSCGISEKEIAEKQAKAEKLEVEKRSIERDLSDLESYIHSLSGTGATLSTVIIGADKAIYSEIFQSFLKINRRVHDAVLEKIEKEQAEAAENGTTPPSPGTTLSPELYNLHGTVAFSLADMPGKSGKMTVEQLEEMMQNGWTTAIYLDRDAIEDVSGYIAQMNAEYDRLGIPRTTTVVFGRSLYMSKHQQALLDMGIECFVEILEEGATILSRDLSEPIWRVRADGWSGKNSSGSQIAAYMSLLNSNGAGAFIITPTYSESRFNAADYRVGLDRVSLENMLNTFLSSIVGEKLRVDSPLSAKQRYAEYLERVRYYEGEYEPIMAPMRARLEEIKGELNELYYGS